jgi:hypothetical protein
MTKRLFALHWAEWTNVPNLLQDIGDLAGRFGQRQFSLESPNFLAPFSATVEFTFAFNMCHDQPRPCLYQLVISR